MVPESSAPGHRKRLREKFLKSGLAGFHDYEIVELLLTLGSPRRDCKQPAKEALRKFRSLKGVLEASGEELQEVKGVGRHNAFGIELIRELANRFLKEKTVGKTVFSSAQEIFDYHAEVLLKVGTVGYAPVPIVVKSDLRNVPERAYWGADALFTGSLLGMQWYFE